MSRFFRSALFPLIVIVLLVYLASQTLLSPSQEAKKETYSDLIAQVRQDPTEVTDVVFNPKSKSIDAKVNGQKVKVNYPSDESQIKFQDLLEENNVAFDSKGTGDSAWWSILTYLLPFVLFFGFWIFLMRQVGSRSSRDDDDSGPTPGT